MVRQTVSRSARHEIEPVKGSRFIAHLAPASDERQAQALLSKARADFPDASHHCSAWRLAAPAIERAHDDGEPSGSAGRPILSQLIGRDVIDVALIVSRWFGGTKLGVGGLVRAYGGAASQVLDAVELDPWVVMTTVSLTHSYAYIDAVDRLVAGHGGTFAQRTFAGEVSSVIRLASDDVETFVHLVADATNGAFQIER